MIETIYKCQNQECGATDKDRGHNPPPPTSLNCWRCHSKGSMAPVAQNEK